MRTIEEEWKIFRKAVVPSDAGEIQVNEMKIGFFAGASILAFLILNMVKDTKEDKISMIKEMTTLMEELSSFANDQANKPQ